MIPEGSELQPYIGEENKVKPKADPP